MIEHVPDVIELAAAAALAFGVGVYSDKGARREIEHRRLLEAAEPVCGCGHHAAYHNVERGTCEYEGWDSKNNCAIPCMCQRYIGPEVF